MPRRTNRVKNIRRESISSKRYICTWKRVIIIPSIDLLVSGEISGKCVVWVGGVKNRNEGSHALRVRVVLVVAMVRTIVATKCIEWAVLVSQMVAVLTVQGRTAHEVEVLVWEVAAAASIMHTPLHRLHPNPTDRAVYARVSIQWWKRRRTPPRPSLQDRQVISYTNIRTCCDYNEEDTRIKN